MINRLLFTKLLLLILLLYHTHLTLSLVKLFHPCLHQGILLIYLLLTKDPATVKELFGATPSVTL